ncbi:aspartate aminotransferase family protein [Fulvivirgaceae bacterium BMA10]|uniref:Aspartate aminotransferase family protein n=1 Tax=Splendidivirga corallicola TaxID=3051826 RepID=A0ABT8KNE2_9BACT|nr:aspartate aminotransferase family protein [Fulvivirgaceae bacterium BMA10]
MDKKNLRSEGDINITDHRIGYWNANIDKSTAELLEMDNQFFLHQSLSTPCLNVMESCKGSSIVDMQGRSYLDFHGNNVHQVGFSNPAVIKAITDQMEKLSFCTRRYTNKPAIDLARKLVELAPDDLNRVLFAPGGSLAIGMALKLARAKTGRFKTISMWDSFHGASLDAISIGGEAIFRSEIGPLLPGTEHVPPPDAQNCPWDCAGECKLKCADYIDYVLEKEGDVAAVIAETVRSTPFIPPKEYWQKVRKACDRHGALLILDEIPHCLGRTGKMFTFEHYGIVPDMVVIGKGLGGGIFPFAALIAREELNVMKEKALGHYTHEKNPVACAASLAAIQFLENEKIPDHVIKIGEYAISGLNKLKQKYNLIKDVRGIGLLIGVELADINGEKALDQAEKIMYLALERGLNFKLTMGNILTLTPALTINYREMDQALNILDSCFKDLTE